MEENGSGVKPLLQLLDFELGEEVGGGQGEEGTRGNDFGGFPEGREMAEVAGDEVVGAGGFGAFEEYIVGGIGSDEKVAARVDGDGAFAEEIEKLAAQAFADGEFGAREDGGEFGEHGRRKVKASGPGEGEDQDGARKAGGLKSGGDVDVGVEDEAQG